jgi:hypothetical protein
LRTSKQQLIDHPESSGEFNADLERVVCAVVRAGVGSFAELAKKVQGAWPPETLKALRRLVKSGAISEKEVEQLSVQQKASGVPVGDDGTSTMHLPEPHPLNFDWRFTPSTQQLLAEKIAGFDPESVALLGTPSLFRPLLSQGRQVDLFDRNRSLLPTFTEEERKTFHCVDLIRPVQNSFSFQLAVVDPPWYQEHYVAFLTRAQELLAPGGKVLLSVLPRLTRPDAESDRAKILRIAYDCGLDLTEVLPASIGYSTPPFEASALLTEGIALADWRWADLYVFVKSNRAPISGTQSDSETYAHDAWRIYVFGETSIAVKCVMPGAGDFAFWGTSAFGEFILHTVSRRSRARLDANIWSSKNHVLTATRTDCVCRLLELLSDGIEQHTAMSLISEQFQLSPASTQELKRLIDSLRECLN